MALKTTYSGKIVELLVSESEALRLGFAETLAMVRSGTRIVIYSESADLPVAVISPPAPRGRTISEAIALAKKCEEEMGKSPVMTADFARDVEEVIRNRKPWNPPAWE